jgi:hypothetical protein
MKQVIILSSWIAGARIVRLEARISARQLQLWAGCHIGRQYCFGRCRSIGGISRNGASIAFRNPIKDV